VVQVGEYQAHLAVAEPRALQLSREVLMQAAPASQPGERVRPRGFRDPSDQRRDALAQADQRPANDGQGADGEDEVMDGAGASTLLRAAHDHDQGREVERREGKRADRLEPGEEVERVDGRPQVEESERARDVVTEVDDERSRDD
jgi:hypothetical protein